jgi:hypothetical protein
VVDGNEPAFAASDFFMRNLFQGIPDYSAQKILQGNPARPVVKKDAGDFCRVLRETDSYLARYGEGVALNVVDIKSKKAVKLIAPRNVFISLVPFAVYAPQNSAQIFKSLSFTFSHPFL